MNIPPPQNLAVSDSYFTDRIHIQDTIVEGDDRKVSEFIHLSSLLNGCPRRRIIMERSGQRPMRTAKGADRVMWELGRAAERHVRKQFIAQMNYQGVVGEWSCPCETHRYRGLYAPESICTTCAKPATTYGELTLSDHDHRITGNPDMLFVSPEIQKLFVLEIKSINKREFDELQIAKPDHVLQAASYHRMASRTVVQNPSDMYPKVVVLYVCKDYSFRGSAYREFHADISKPAVVSAVQYLWDEARQVVEARAANSLPARLSVCSSVATTTAKNCAVCASCFNHSA